MPELKFIVDAMLGDLARWLRMLGYDTIYAGHMPDRRIIELARRDGRLIVTRDRGLAARARRDGVQVLVVDAEELPEKLAYLARRLGISLNIDPDKSRCPLCNGVLRRVERSVVRGRVPPRVYEAYDVFWMCTRCGQVYWRGSHWRSIERIVEEARRLCEGQRSRASSAAQLR